MPYPQGIQRDASGRPFLYMPNGQPNYISPAAFGQGGGPLGINGPDAQSYLHTGSQWNTESGRWDNPINWSNILSTAVGGFLGAGALSAAGAFGGGSSAFVGPTAAQAGGSGAAAGGSAAAGGFVGPTLAQAAGPGLAGVTPGVAGGGSALSSIMGYANSPYFQLAQLGLSAAGGALGNKNSATQTTSPTLDPAYSPLQQLLLEQTLARLSSGAPDLTGYANTGISNINKGYDLVRQRLDQSLTDRGLGASPTAGAGMAKLEAGRGGDIANFQNTIPLLKDQMQRQNLQDAIALLTQGRGSTSTGESNTGGGWAGAATNLAQMLGYLYGTRRQTSVV